MYVCICVFVCGCICVFVLMWNLLFVFIWFYGYVYLWKRGFVETCVCEFVEMCIVETCVCYFVETWFCENVCLWVYGYVYLLKRGFVEMYVCGFVCLWICVNVVLCEFYSPKKTRRTRILSACSSCYSLAFGYNQIVMSVVSLFHSSLTVMVMRCWWLYSEPVMVVILLRSKGTSGTVMVA